MVSNKNTIKIDGVVEEALPSVTFRVKLENDKEILARLAGKLRMYRIKVLAGDKVTVEMSSPNDDRGRIIYRKK